MESPHPGSPARGAEGCQGVSTCWVGGVQGRTLSAVHSCEWCCRALSRDVQSPSIQPPLCLCFK